jgi:general secretion pathway protein M
MKNALPEGPRGRILAVMLTLTVLAALWFGCVQPLIDWHATRAETLAQQRIRLRHMSELVATLPELRRQVTGDRAPTVALLEGDSDAVAGATLQGDVQSMATTAGAELSSIETLPAEQRGAYRRIGLHVAMSAPWPALVALLSALQEGTPRMLVDNLQLRAPPVEYREATTPVSADFTIVAFRAVAQDNPAGAGVAGVSSAAGPGGGAGVSRTAGVGNGAGGNSAAGVGSAAGRGQ